MTFDYSGEHCLTGYSNVFSRHKNWAGYLPTLFNVQNLGYKISDYKHSQDWLSLGMGHTASQVTSMIAKKKDVHKNNFKKFRQMLIDIPYSERALTPYNLKHKMKLNSPVSYEAVKSILKTIDYIEPIFTEKTEEYNIPFLLAKYKHVNINLRLGTGNLFAQRMKARLLVGKVLEKLVPHLHKYKPVLVFEEADLICPQLREDEYFSSADWIRQYILKIGRRAGCMMIFIVQNENRCDDTVKLEFDFKMAHEFTPFRSDRGIFSFASQDYYQKKSNSKILFKPFDVSNRFENYPIIST